mmetsp:Transcript_38668/g.110317  ORF Transcript_38668/g.110317 Transcript_38668/m.110317 type:complete len:516 (-) Transcript_38668:82-1629(-)
MLEAGCDLLGGPVERHLVLLAVQEDLLEVLLNLPRVRLLRPHDRRRLLGGHRQDLSVCEVQRLQRSSACHGLGLDAPDDQALGRRAGALATTFCCVRPVDDNPVLLLELRPVEEAEVRHLGGQVHVQAHNVTFLELLRLDALARSNALQYSTLNVSRSNGLGNLLVLLDALLALGLQRLHRFLEGLEGLPAQRLRECLVEVLEHLLLCFLREGPVVVLADVELPHLLHDLPRVDVLRPRNLDAPQRLINLGHDLLQRLPLLHHLLGHLLAGPSGEVRQGLEVLADLLIEREVVLVVLRLDPLRVCEVLLGRADVHRGLLRLRDKRLFLSLLLATAPLPGDRLHAGLWVGRIGSLDRRKYGGRRSLLCLGLRLGLGLGRGRLRLRLGLRLCFGLALRHGLRRRLRLGFCFCLRLGLRFWLGLCLGLRFGLRLRFGLSFRFCLRLRLRLGLGRRCLGSLRLRLGLWLGLRLRRGLGLRLAVNRGGAGRSVRLFLLPHSGLGHRVLVFSLTHHRPPSP